MKSQRANFQPCFFSLYTYCTVQCAYPRAQLSPYCTDRKKNRRKLEVQRVFFMGGVKCTVSLKCQRYMTFTSSISANIRRFFSNSVYLILSTSTVSVLARWHFHLPAWLTSTFCNITTTLSNQFFREIFTKV